MTVETAIVQNQYFNLNKEGKNANLDLGHGEISPNLQVCSLFQIDCMQVSRT